MSNTNQIFEKVAALKEKEIAQEKSSAPKRKGVWEEVDTLMDKDSGIGVVITKRMRGKPGYSMQILHFDNVGANKFIPVPCPGAKYPVEDIVRALTARARDFIEKELEKESNAGRKRPHKMKTDGGYDVKVTDNSRGRLMKPTGLSELARQDAASKGQEFVGKTARKKNRGK